MEDMKESHLAIFLAQNKKDSVKQLDEFGEVIKPAGVYHPHCSRWLRIVHNVASKRITCTPARHHKLIAHIHRKQYYEKIVRYHRFLEFKGLPVLHELWSQRCNKIDVEPQDDGLWQRRGHEEPVFNSWISIFDPIIIKTHSPGCKIAERHFLQDSLALLMGFSVKQCRNEGRCVQRAGT